MSPDVSPLVSALGSSTDKQEAVVVDWDAVLDVVTKVVMTLTVVLGITGNSIVIWVAGFKLKPKVTNVWLVNLAFADLIFCFTRAFSLAKKFLNDWPFGVFLCKFNGFFKYANMFCSVFLLAVISLDRTLCVWRPVLTKQRRTLLAARVVAVCVWVVAIVLSGPYFVYRNVYVNSENVTKCSMKDTTPGKELALYTIRFTCGFLLPFLVILICYVLAGLGIRRTRLTGKSRPLRILAVLVVAFFVCWAPYHCLLLVKRVDSKNKVVKMGQSLASAVAYFNSCINPLLYFFMGLNVRGRFQQTLLGVYKKALDDDVATRSNDRSLDDSGGSKQTTLMGPGRTLVDVAKV